MGGCGGGYNERREERERRGLEMGWLDLRGLLKVERNRARKVRRRAGRRGEGENW